MPRKPNEREFKLIVPLTEQKKMEEIATEMTKNFGGVTIIPFTRGFWLDSEGKAVYDDSVIMLSSRDIKRGQDHLNIFKKDWEFMQNLASKIAKELEQDTVFTQQDIIKDVELVKPYRRMKEVF